MELKRIGFRGQKVELIEALANWLNRLGNRSTGCPCPIEVQSRSAKNTFSHPVASSSQLRLTPSRSRFDRGPVEAMVTYQALNASTASEPVNP